MTAQMPNCVIYQGEEFIIAIGGVKGSGLITPHQFGIKPVGVSSDNWIGFYNTYGIEAGQLILTEMAVESDAHPPIQGVLPVKPNEYDPPTYRGLKMAVPFTGSLLLVRDLTDEISRFMDFGYTYSGMQRYFEYQTVFEMHFDNGKLTQFADQSAKMSALRSQLIPILEAQAKELEPISKEHDELRREQTRIMFKAMDTNTDYEVDPKYQELDQRMEKLTKKIQLLNATYSAKAEKLLKPLLLDYDEL